MLALTTKHHWLICSAVICLFHFGALRCEAQRKDGSLFVIKAPATGETGSYNAPAKTPRVASLKAALVTSAQTEEETPVLGSSSRENRRIDFSAPAPDEKPDALLEEIRKLDKEMDADRQSKEDEQSNAKLDQMIKDSNAERDERVKDRDEKLSEPTMTTWNLKPISDIRPMIRPDTGDVPADQSWQLTNRPPMPLAASLKRFAWAAPNIKYNPLYFEDVAHERYGQTKGLWLQPVASGLHFVKSAALLPYYSIYDPVNSCDGPLGYCRPGTQVECQKQRLYFGNPFSARR